MKITYFFIFISYAWLAGCGSAESAGDSLTGSWKQQGEGANIIFDFHADGTGYWIYQFGEKLDSFALKYVLDESTNPGSVELQGSKGPFAKGSMYCRIELNGNKEMKMDCKEYIPGADVKTTMPEKFREKTTAVFKKMN